jgi:CheY-like chemotaxis protein
LCGWLKEPVLCRWVKVRPRSDREGRIGVLGLPSAKQYDPAGISSTEDHPSGCITRSGCRLDVRLRSNSLGRALTLVSLTLRNSNAFIVCLLDDDPSVLKGLGRLLLSADLRAETFSDPEEFLRHARTHRPAVALVDVHMPQMSGLEVQSRLREISPSTRVIIFTGKDDPLVRSTALNAGASAFLSKPFGDEELLTAVRLAFASAN